MRLLSAILAILLIAPALRAQPALQTVPIDTAKDGYRCLRSMRWTGFSSAPVTDFTFSNRPGAATANANRSANFRRSTMSKSSAPMSTC